MRKLFLFLSIAFIVASCSKDEADPSPLHVSNEDYFPNTTGSSWLYDGVFAGEMVVTGETKSFGGKEYSELETFDGSGSSISYLHKNDGKYYLRGFVDDTDLELLVLKENESVSATWKQSITIQGGVNTFKYTLLAKDIQETVGGVVFQNVIVVRMNQSFQFLGTKYELSTMHFHFAKGVGLIQIDTEYDPITGLESLNGTSELTDFEIL